MNKTLINKIAMLAAGGVLVAIFFTLDLQQYLTLGYLKESQARLSTLYQQSPVLVIAGIGHFTYGL